MSLTGDKVELRPIKEADTDFILKWRNSENIRRQFIFQNDITRGMHLSWLRDEVNAGRCVQFIIINLTGGFPIGSVYLRDIDKTHNKAEFGIYIGEESCIGKGYGSEATRLIINYGFDVLSLHKIFLRVLSDNERAIASYLKTGFVKEGCFKDDVFINGKYCDVVFMSIINDN